MEKRRNLVYSTAPGWEKNKNIDMSHEQSNQDIIYIRRDRKGRGGKTVTVVENYLGDAKPMLKRLQKLCGGGGSVKNSNLEIQGDHREKIADYLSNQGFKVKLKGG